MRVLNPKKSSGSNGVRINKSGDLSFSNTKKARTDKLINLKVSIEELTEKELVQSIDDDARPTVRKKLRAKKSTTQAITAKESPEEIAKKEYGSLYNKGIHLLSMREHSVKEITTKLSAKCERLELVSAVVDELLENNYLSNDRFTESYVRAKQQRGIGPTKISNELLNKGIKNSMIELYLDAASAVWYDNVRNLYHKKYGDEPISDYNTWTKRARFLQSRGFTMDHIHSTIPPVEYD